VNREEADLRPRELHGNDILQRLGQFVRHVKLKNGVLVMIRAIRTSDEPLMARFHERLTDRSVYLRYFSTISLSHRVAHEQLARICAISDREFALVAALEHERGDEQEIIGLGQMMRQNGLNEAEAELGLIVRDDYQNQGLGTRLSECLLEISRAAGAQRAVSLMLWENDAMRMIGRRLGCNMELIIGEHALRATIAL
jgi:acetyltransferase